jgi:hypothetical protein
VRGGKGDDQIGRALTSGISFETGQEALFADAEYVQDEDNIDGIRRVRNGEAFDSDWGFQTKEALYGEQGDDLMYGGPV